MLLVMLSNLMKSWMILNISLATDSLLSHWRPCQPHESMVSQIALDVSGNEW